MTLQTCATLGTRVAACSLCPSTDEECRILRFFIRFVANCVSGSTLQWSLNCSTFAFACFRFVHASSFQDQRLFWTGQGSRNFSGETAQACKVSADQVIFKLYIDMFPTIAFLIAFCSPDFLAQQSIMEYTDYSHAKSVLAAFFAPANSNHTAQHAADT